MKEGDVVKAFLLLIVVPIVCGAAVGLVMGGLAGVNFLSLGASIRTSRTIIWVSGGAAGLAIGYFLFRRLGIPFIARKLLPAPSWPSYPAQTQPGMRVEYRMRYIDYLLFNTVHTFLNPVLQGVVVFITGLTFAAGLSDKTIAESLVTAGCLFAAMWAAQIALYAAMLFSKKEDANLTDHILELADDGLHDLTRFNESRFFWPGIVRVVKRPGFVAIYITQHAAYVIPARAFQSNEMREKFVEFVREKMRAG